MNENYWTGRKFGEPLPTLRLEQDEPDHFGGGENIKILDYQTEHYLNKPYLFSYLKVID